MEQNKGFSFYKNYWDSIQTLSEEDQKNVCYAIAKYAITGEMVSPIDCPMGYAMTMAFKISIDNSTKSFNGKAEAGKKGGRTRKEGIEEIIKEGVKEKKKASEIAAAAGVSVETIYKNEIWKNRHLVEG